MSRTHILKTWPSQWRAVASGEKRFEIRINDRDFSVGDVLDLRMFDPTPTAEYDGWCLREQAKWIPGETYQDRALSLRARVTHVVHGGRFGIDPRYCVMSIAKIDGGAG